jgi:excisionase family DNA binding protein
VAIVIDNEDADVKLYTTSQVAKLCEVTQPTVRNWITSQKLRAIKINGKLRIRKSDLIVFFNERYSS